MPRDPGRPKLASRELLQEAAFELFQIRGYRRTSVELIARTAGFSRATFFNCFDSKAELFWVDTDALLSELETHLEEVRRTASDSAAALPPLREVVCAYASTIRSADIPWSLQNGTLISAEHDLVASGAGRVLRLQRSFERYERGRQNARRDREGAHRADADTAAHDAARVEASVVTAVALSSLRQWVDAGVERGDLGTQITHDLGLLR